MSSEWRTSPLLSKLSGGAASIRFLCMPGFLSGFSPIVSESGFRAPDTRSDPLPSVITLRSHCPEVMRLCQFDPVFLDVGVGFTGRAARCYMTVCITLYLWSAPTDISELPVALPVFGKISSELHSSWRWNRLVGLILAVIDDDDDEWKWNTYLSWWWNDGNCNIVLLLWRSYIFVRI
jgi:hypothetical protein